MYSVLGNTYLNHLEHSPCINLPEEMANGVVHPVTKETLSKYHKIIEVPELKEVWMTGMGIELGRLAQGYKDTKGTNTIKFMTLEEIKHIPKDRVVTYARIVPDYRPQKKDPNRVRITARGKSNQLPIRTHDSNSRPHDIQNHVE